MNVPIGQLLDDATGRFSAPYFAAIHDLYVATLTDNRPAASDARCALQRAMHDAVGMGEILGAAAALRTASGVLTRHANLGADRSRMLVFAAGDDQQILPDVTFQEALDALVSRTPVTIRAAAERTAQRISHIYSTDRVMAFVRSAEQSVTEAAQKFIAHAVREGLTENVVGRQLAMTVEAVRAATAPWSESYSRMVFRTNVNTAVTAGRFRQAQDPDVRAIIPALRFDSVNDSDTRANHSAADGLIMSVTNINWNRIAPPLGYNCRCRVVHVSRFELEDIGRVNAHGDVVESQVPSTAFPDPGFRHSGRPDLFSPGVS